MVSGCVQSRAALRRIQPRRQLGATPETCAGLPVACYSGLFRGVSARTVIGRGAEARRCTPTGAPHLPARDDDLEWLLTVAHSLMGARATHGAIIGAFDFSAAEALFVRASDQRFDLDPSLVEIEVGASGRNPPRGSCR